MVVGEGELRRWFEVENCSGGSRWKTAVVAVGSAEATSCCVNFMISGLTYYKLKYISLPLLR